MGINVDECGAGMLMRLLPRTSINFPLAGSATQALPIAQHIEVSGFTEVDLMVRFHTGTIGVGATILVAVFPDGWDFDDPSVSWGPAAALANGQPGVVQLTSASTAPLLQVAMLGGALTNAPFGRFVSVLMSVAMPAAPVVVNPTLSIDLALKGGNGGAMPMSPNAFRGYRMM